MPSGRELGEYEERSVKSPELAAAEFVDRLQQRGFDYFTGVPCSIFEPLYHELEHRPALRYVPALREDSAVGIAAGAYFGGRRPIVVIQNSGLGYSLNAYTSLILPYGIPLITLISWRGYEGKDAPEHLIMGACMPQLIRDIGAPLLILGETGGFEEFDRAADMVTREGSAVFLAVRPGALR
jgi:sulfopyruvate decarboxylase subunit alpha